MDKNYLALSSIAMDLKRVAIGYHNGSIQMANRFFRESLIRRAEIDTKAVAPYMRKLLKKLPKIISSHDKGKIAEDALVFSTLLQNAALKEDQYNK